MKKNDILINLAHYASNIDSLRKEIDDVNLPSLIFVSDAQETIQSQPFINAFLSCKALCQKASIQEQALRDLLIEAQYRDAIIKTGNVKKQIQGQINKLSELKENLIKKNRNDDFHLPTK